MRRIWARPFAIFDDVGMWFALLLLAVCSSRAVQALQPLSLDLGANGAEVTATSVCGFAADGSASLTEYAICAGDPQCVRTCGGGEIAHGAELAVDGDRGTSWQSPPLSFYQALGESIGSHNLTIDLGRAVHVVEVQVWTGEGEFPADLELYGSLDGAVFILLASISPTAGTAQVVAILLSVADDQQELTIEQRAASHVRYLRLHLLAPPTFIVPSDPRTAFFSVGEVEVRAVEEGVCPPIVTPLQQCYGGAVLRRSLILLSDPALHRLLWQRDDQSDLWNLDDVTLLVEECPVGMGGCEGGRVRVDFNGTVNLLFSDSDSLPTSTSVGPRPCPDPRDPALLVPPGDQIISRPLSAVVTGLIFGVEFPAQPPFCSMGAEYSPVEVRQCRSIEGVLGECVLLALVSSSECGNCLDQLTFQLRSLQEAMDSALFPANLTLLNDLHTAIHVTLDGLEVLEGLLLVLQAGVGSLIPLPPSALPLPSKVPRLDLQLVPPILTKLEELQSLLEQMPTITVISTDDLVVLYSSLRTRLEAEVTTADQLLSRQTDVSLSVDALLRSLSDIADAVSVARATANQIAILISSRRYFTTEVRVQTLVTDVLDTFGRANRILGLAQINSQHVQDVASRLIAVGELLEKADSLAVGVAIDVLREALAVELAVAALLREAIEVLRTGEIVLEEGEVAVATGQQLLLDARNLYQSSTQAVPDIIDLSDQLNQSVQSYRPGLAGFLQACSSGGGDCTAGEEHVTGLTADLTFFVNSSVSLYTLDHANDILTALRSTGTPLDVNLINRTALRSTGTPLDVNLINRTALLAQETAREAIDRADRINSTLGDVVSQVISSARQLSQRGSDSLGTSDGLSAVIASSLERAGQLTAVLGERQADHTLISERVEDIAALDQATDEATQLLQRANASLDAVRGVEGRVGEVREGAGQAREQLSLIAGNVQSAESTLQDTEQRFPLVSRLLTATQTQAQAFQLNVTSFIAENDRIVKDIDALIARLSSVHTSIAMINSPVRLSSEPAASEEVPYLSLQPPPGRQLEGVVQFEDLDLYMWPSARYQTPSLLFYAGPVRFPEQQNGTEPDTREDVVWLMAEEDQLRLGWELGGYHANKTYPIRVEGESQLRLTRDGSQFQLQFSPSAEEVLQERSLVNGSLLFHSSHRTAFLLGGWPHGAQLGTEAAPLPLSSLRGFEGQFQLALFNGLLWGLWNVRSTSATDFIGEREFRRNALTRSVVWHANPGFLRTASTLSFDGSGYLFTEQFGTETEFATFAAFLSVILYLRSNDAGQGLVMYAYQPQESVSLEVFLRDGQINVLISRHDTSEVLVNHTETTSGEEEDLVSISYVPAARRYLINDRVFNNVLGSRFFTNLQEVRAWFGGVKEDQLEDSYVPHEKVGYFGCLDMYVRRNFDSVFEIFRGSSFTDHYLNSPLQSGLSATCYATVYVREVSFAAGAEGLAYTYLPLPPRPSPCLTSSSTHTLSLSVLPLEGDGYILAARDQGSTVSVLLRSGVVEATISTGSGAESIFSLEPLELGTWHYLLLSLDLLPTQELQFSLFVDGLLQGTISSTLPNFSLDLPTSAPVDVANPTPVLFVGGVPLTSDPSITTPTFSGCMQDLTFDLCPLSFQSPSMVERYPPGVRYHTCPPAPVVPSPQLPVQPAPPQQRVCGGAAPVELGFTHGGFARDTQLRSSSVAGLLGSEWMLTFALRQRSPGHVISVRSVTGAGVRVEVVEGGRGLGLALTVSGDDGSETTLQSFIPGVPHDVFTVLSLECAVLSPVFVCNLTMDGQLVSQGEAQVISTLFDPDLPIILGRTQDSQGNMVAGFEGCVANLAVNGDASGFQGVGTDTPCYNQTLPGLGFTGISRISQLLPAPGPEAGGEVALSLRVRPLLETGVLLVLTEPLGRRRPVLAVGLVQGELRVSDVSNGYLVLAEALCDPTNEMTFELMVNYTLDHISVDVAGRSVVSPQLPLLEIGQLVMTVGNVPVDLQSGDGLSFLLSEAVSPSATPAGLAGCLTSASVMGSPLTLDTADQADNVLDGFCPRA